MEEKVYECAPECLQTDTAPEEQPNCIQSHTADADYIKGDTDANERSSLGKFKSVQDLLNGYNSLQSEFTRKCQKLSELEKNSISTSDNLVKAQGDISTPSATNSAPAAKLDEILQGSSEKATLQNVSPLLYQSENWQEVVDDFVIKNPEAKKYAADISTLILQDKVVASSDNPLELAWAKVLAAHYKEPSAICEDEEFVNKYILTNENIRKKVLMDYLQKVSDSKSPPVIIKSLGSQVAPYKANAPKTLREAAKLAEEMLKF